MTLTIFADYSQFYLEDARAGLPDLWDEQSVADMIATAPGVIGVGTARNYEVPVTVALLDAEPREDLRHWDHVAEATLALPSGELVVFGPTEGEPDWTRIAVEPGVYAVRVHYAGLETVAANGIDGDDFYKVMLWPTDAERSRRVLKRSDWPTRSG